MSKNLAVKLVSEEEEHDAMREHHEGENTAKRKDWRKEANKWLGDNPHIYTLFKKFALQAAKRFKGKIGRQLIAERVRWESYMGPYNYDGQDYKLNTNYLPYIMRKMEKEVPELKGRFDFRAVRY